MLPKKLPQEFIDFVNNNPKLVTRRESVRYPGLYVLKYSRKVFYDALWNDILEECRGTVIDKDWNVVVRPFKKIYNRNENGADFSLDQEVTAVYKINGFMAAATFVPSVEKVVISTTGSLDSDFVSLAEKWLNPSIVPYINAYGYNITWLFEICDPSDPHIIEELPGVYLIGARFLAGGMSSEQHLDATALIMGVKRPQHFVTTFGEVVKEIKNCRHEGFVVHGPDKSLKIKSPYYLFAKFIARSKDKKFEEILNGNFDKTIDEEFYPLLQYLRCDREAVLKMNEQERLSYIRKFINVIQEDI